MVREPTPGYRPYRTAETAVAIARRFRSRAETARYGRYGLTELRRWPQWILGRPPRRGYSSERQFCGVVAASLGDATHAILIVLVAAIRIALDNGNGGV